MIEDRPDHDVTIAVTFRATTTEPELLPRLLAADALPEEIKALVRKRTTTDNSKKRAERALCEPNRTPCGIGERRSQATATRWGRQWPKRRGERDKTLRSG